MTKKLANKIAANILCHLSRMDETETAADRLKVVSSIIVESSSTSMNELVMEAQSLKLLAAELMQRLSKLQCLAMALAVPQVDQPAEEETDLLRRAGGQ